MKVMVAGANGFLGSAIVEAVLQAGHQVVACARSRRNLPAAPAVHPLVADLRIMRTPDHWLPHLTGVSVVVNCAGILRESRQGDFELVHMEVPMALVEACRREGGIKFIQISALGVPADGPFITSKHRFDEALLGSGLPATVIRPSVVLSTRGSYGGTSLLRALSALPGIIFLPGQGEQRFQPVLLEDLAALVVRCLPPAVAEGQVLYSVGPEVLSIREYLGLVRGWLKLPDARQVPVPQRLVGAVAVVGELLGTGPLGQTIAGMLKRGNVAPPGSWEETHAATGTRSRSVREVLQSAPSFVQDRWHARLYLLRPLLRLLLVAVWIVSGLVGLAATPSDYAPILTRVGIPLGTQGGLVLATSLLDISLGVGLLLRWRPRVVMALMLVSVLGYTLLLGLLALPSWFDPLGGLVKNLAVLGLLLVCWVLEDAR
jgi:uncharacterized protein YbjT (DUF2867 family)